MREWSKWKRKLSTSNPDKSEIFKMVERFIVECRGCGLQLPYSDLTIIAQWIDRSPNFDLLLMILSDLIPEYFERKADRRIPPSLKGLDKKVNQRLFDLTKRRLVACDGSESDCIKS